VIIDDGPATGPPPSDSGPNEDAGTTTTIAHQSADVADASPSVALRSPGRHLGEHAEAYARAGLPVFPLRPRSKVPATKHGKDDATLDVDQIRQFWQRHPNYNIAITPRVGEFVLDEDVQHGGDRALAEMRYQFGDLPQTWTARTGQGGRHIWLRADPPFRGRLCGGVDIKCHTGYLVAPPSVHPNGRTYTWLNVLPIAYSPVWLLPLIAPPPPSVLTPGMPFSGDAGDALVAFVAGSAEGNRNSALFWAAKKAVAEGRIDGLRAELLRVAIAVGLSANEAQATISSAIKAAK
jgi:hypothetical protein